MADSLFSPLWYRVAELAPRLAGGVTARRAHYRDQAWYVLINSATGRQFRVNHKAYQFIGCCDGWRSVQAIWDALLESARDQAPTQDEVVRLIAQLADAGLLDCGVNPDFEAQFERRDKRKGAARRFPNPLAFRIPLGDPTVLLKRLGGVAALMFHPLALWAWLIAVALACAGAAMHWNELATHAATYMSTPRYLFLAWISFPFIKALHELAHGLAVRHWGGEVHEAGIGMFVLTPAPYVDASASAGFRRRRQRAGVAAMGIMVEFALAAAALLVWLNVQPGMVRDLAFVTMSVASFSTVVFNANPLLQFDGYHVLCDLFDLPNLGSRSRRYWALLLARAVPGGGRPDQIEALAGEAKWLLAYAPLSFAYRMFVSAMIVLWVGNFSLVLGVLVAAYVALTALVMPAVATARSVVEGAAGAPQRRRARAAVAVAAAACVLFACLIPLPFRTAAWGVVWLPEHAQARPETDGFISAFMARDGERVIPGQLLLKMDDPALFAKRDKLQSQLAGLRADRFDSFTRDNLKAGNLEEEMRRVEGELRRTDERIALLEVRSHAAGTFVMPTQQDVLGTWVKRGSLLGYILDRKEIAIRAAVPERDAALIRQGGGRVEVRLAEALPDVLVAGLVRDVPAAAHELPSAALGDRGGGPYVTDPADKDGVRTVEPVVLIDLALPERALEHVGGRVWVRFEHGSEPLAVQSWRRMRQLFLQHFNPTG